VEAGEELPLPGTVEELLAPRVAALPDPVRRALLSVALGGSVGLAEADVEHAVAAGVLVVDEGRARAAHPLLAAAAVKHSTARERRELHLALAETAVDEELRALHLALAAETPDDNLSTTVARAAASASARGAAREAVVLAEHALRLTPGESAARSD